MTARELKCRTRRELAEMARDRGIRGWHDMRKRDLVSALVSALVEARQDNRAPASRDGGAGRPKRQSRRRSNRPAAPRVRHAAGPIHQDPARSGGPDQLAVRWLGGGWIGLTWSLSARTVEQARSALGSDWSRCAYTIRLVQLEGGDGSGGLPQVVLEESLHGAVDRWFLRTESVRGRFTVQLGFGARGNGQRKGRFHAVIRSGAIDFGSKRAETADAAGPDTGRSRPDRFGLSMPARYRRTSGASGPGNEFELKLSAEVLLEGRVTPGSRLKCLDEPVEVDQHGEFHLCVPLPDGRQVIHLEAVTPDGAEQRTTVFAVERNTKQLEPRPLNEPDFEDAFE